MNAQGETWTAEKPKTVVDWLEVATGSAVFRHGENEAFDKDAFIDAMREILAIVRLHPELVKALEKSLPRLAHKFSCVTSRPTSEWSEHGSMNYENCDCEIKICRDLLARAHALSCEKP